MFILITYGARAHLQGRATNKMSAKGITIFFILITNLLKTILIVIKRTHTHLLLPLLAILVKIKKAFYKLFLLIKK